MEKHLKNALILLLAVFALLGAVAALTGALPLLKRINPFLFMVASLFFIASIFVWLISWAHIIKKSSAVGRRSLTIAGFCCVFAALTPIQLGAEALRSIKLKDSFGIPYSESIAASMIVKGLKFLVIAAVSGIAFVSFLSNQLLGPWLKLGMASGFAVISIAALLFLLPMHYGTGVKIAGLFGRLAGLNAVFGKLGRYFNSYASYLKKVSKRTIALTLVLSLASLSLEFAAFLCCFLAVNAAIPLQAGLTLFMLSAILERTPFLPRGIGAVEAAAFAFLSMRQFTAVQLSAGEIGAVIIIFDLARLVVPTLASLVVYAFVFRGKGTFKPATAA